ncbi:MAG: cytochrome c biogenesis CcdA family protein [Candidatus Saccharibacteria bacterium]
MGIVATASLITAFLAGGAALFAPCCIGVLLPSYLASVFKTRTKIFLMTFVYYLGLLTVFLPIGLGFATLGTLLSQYHSTLFTIGGLFMIALGITMLLGRSYMLPMRVHPTLKKHDFGSIYVLGIFSGIATSCCAPVLAGVMALSTIPGSQWLGTFYALAFVTGMVVPLFLVAFAVDRKGIAKKLESFRRQVSYSIFGKKVTLNLSHLLAGILYLLIGVFILIFERGGPNEFGGGYQIQIDLVVAQLTRAIARLTNGVPEAIWAILFLAIFIGIAAAAYRQVQHNPTDKEDEL